MPGLYKVKFYVTPDGKVVKAGIHRRVAGTPIGECIRKAVMLAHFPAFDGKSISFVYPSSLPSIPDTGKPCGLLCRTG